MVEVGSEGRVPRLAIIVAASLAVGVAAGAWLTFSDHGEIGASDSSSNPAVASTSVLEGSPGGKAGLRPGDEIISYNGERTFSMTDLRELTMAGEAGENAIIEIDRDGVRMQLSIPRGPIGMNGSGASVRTMNWWGG